MSTAAIRVQCIGVRKCRPYLDSRKNCKLRIFLFLMDLPIDDKELATIVSAMHLGGDTALYQKLKLVKELRDQDLPYKKILREQYGMAA